MQSTRILIADDNADARETMARLLMLEDDLELVAMAEDARDAAVKAEQHRPDVAIVDVNMPLGGGPIATRGVRSASPQTRVIALSAQDDRESVLEMVRAGAVGYLVKGAPADEILTTIRDAAAGQGHLSPAITKDVLEELAGHLERQEDRRARRVAIERQISAVLDGAGITTVFQPIVDLRIGRAVGFEALSRFGPEPKRGPDVWFAEAKEVGLEADLEAAAMRAALMTIPELPPEAFVSVNVSPDTLLSASFRARLEDIPLDRAVVEITEHAPVEDYDQLNAAITSLREEGARLAIDDAGAGFASLTHILKLSPDLIKLDVGLTRGIDTDLARRALAKALISFAEEIGAEIVAEGIETPDELEALRGLDVDYGQGYHLGRPAPAGEAPNKNLLAS